MKMTYTAIRFNPSGRKYKCGHEHKSWELATRCGASLWTYLYTGDNGSVQRSDGQIIGIYVRDPTPEEFEQMMRD